MTVSIRPLQSLVLRRACFCCIITLQMAMLGQQQGRPPAQGRFAFSVPTPAVGGDFGLLQGRVGISFPQWGLYLNYTGGAFTFNQQLLPLYGAGVSMESSTVYFAARAIQSPLHLFLPYLATASSFHGGEGTLGIRLGNGALDFAGVFRIGMARTLHYLDDNRLLLLASLEGNALIDRGVFSELRALLFFDWLRDMKDEQGKFAIRGSVPFRISITPDSAVRWYLTPFFGYIRPTTAGASQGILTDFFYAPDSKILGDSTAGFANELRVYPFQQTSVLILEDFFLAGLGSLSVYHLSPKKLTHLEEHYRFGGAVGFRILKAILAGMQVGYSPVEQWQIYFYMKGET